MNVLNYGTNQGTSRPDSRKSGIPDVFWAGIPIPQNREYFFVGSPLVPALRQNFGILEGHKRFFDHPSLNIWRGMVRE